MLTKFPVKQIAVFVTGENQFLIICGILNEVAGFHGYI